MEVRAARGAAELDAALTLRKRVFCGEQGVPLSAERDGRDPEALHVVALEGGEVIGTCRVLIDGELARLGRMAVAAGARRGGVGRALLDAAERLSAEAGARRMALHSQLAVRDLYAQAGYVPVGEPFVEEGIDHMSMEKRLA